MVVNLAIQTFVVDAWKTYEHAPRPFWVYDNIHGVKCYTQFGNPSGHSIAASYFAYYVYFMYVRELSDFEFYFSEDDDGKKIQQSELFTTKMSNGVKYTLRKSSQQYGTLNRFSIIDRLQDLSKVQKYLILLLLTTIVFCMMLSRMILGVHFLDQVLFGYILGLLTLAFVKEVTWPLMMENVQNHKLGKFSRKQIWIGIVKFFAFNMFAFLLNFVIFIYAVNQNWFELNHNYLTNI